MRSTNSVRRSHTTTTYNLNRRKTHGKAIKAHRNQMKQWIASSVLSEKKPACIVDVESVQRVVKVAETAPKKEQKTVKAEKVQKPKQEKKTQPKVEKKPEPKAEKKTAPKVEKKAEPKVEKKAEPKVEKKAEPKVEKKAEPVVEKKPEPVVEKKPEPVVEKKPEPKVEDKPAPKADKKSEKKSEKKTEKKSEKKPEPKVEKPAEPIVEKKDEAVVEKKPEPVVEKKPEPVVEEKPEPVVEKKADPVIEQVVEEKVELKTQNSLESQKNNTNNTTQINNESGKKNKKNKNKNKAEQNGCIIKNESAPPKQVETPVQVCEVTSSVSDKENLSDSDSADKSENRPQTKTDKKLLENVQKLASQVAAKMENQLDPQTKLHIDAQLYQLSQKIQLADRDRSQTPVLNVVTPLPIQNISRPVTPTMRERIHKLLPQDILFCSRLIDKHGDNFEAMVKDPNNTYRENARSLQRKIRIFKESPHYQVYLDSKKNSIGLEELLTQQAV